MEPWNLYYNPDPAIQAMWATRQAYNAEHPIDPAVYEPASAGIWSGGVHYVWDEAKAVWDGGNNMSGNISAALGVLGGAAGVDAAMTVGAGTGPVGMAVAAFGAAVFGGISNASSYGDPGTAPTD